MILLTFVVLISSFVQKTYADIINSDYHPVKVCSRITNLNEFPIAVFQLTSGRGPGGFGSAVGWKILTKDLCMEMVRWPNSSKLYWTKKTYLDSIGIEKIIDTLSVYPGHVQVHAFSDSMVFYIPPVSNTNPLQSEEYYYTLQKNGNDYSIYLSSQVSHLSDGSLRTKTFSPPPAPEGIIVRGFTRLHPIGSIQMVIQDSTLRITSKKSGNISGGVRDEKEKNILNLSHFYKAGEGVSFDLKSLSPGVYSFFLTTQSDKESGTFTIIAPVKQ